MFESELCNFFMYGFLCAGVLGFIAGRLRILSKRAARASKKICVCDATRRDGIAQRAGDMFLADDSFPGLRPPFSVECLSHVSRSVTEANRWVNRER